MVIVKLFIVFAAFFAAVVAALIIGQTLIYLIFGVWFWLDDHYFTITLGDIKGKWLNISLFSGTERLINDMENSAERLRRLNEELIEKYGGEIDRKYEQENESDTHL